jgi:hypothetical protein|nr:hypothetical protein [Pseudomonas serbica]
MFEQVVEYWVVPPRQAGKPDQVDRPGAVLGRQQFSGALEQWQHRDPKSCSDEKRGDQAEPAIMAIQAHLSEHYLWGSAMMHRKQ